MTTVFSVCLLLKIWLALISLTVVLVIIEWLMRGLWIPSSFSIWLATSMISEIDSMLFVLVDCCPDCEIATAGVEVKNMLLFSLFFQFDAQREFCLIWFSTFQLYIEKHSRIILNFKCWVVCLDLVADLHFKIFILHFQPIWNYIDQVLVATIFCNLYSYDLKVFVCEVTPYTIVLNKN